jgi:hypothetical protein
MAAARNLSSAAPLLLRPVEQAMTQSDFEFIDQIVANRFGDASPIRSWSVPVWFSVLAAGAVVIGTALGLTI